MASNSQVDDITRCDTETVTKTVTNWFYQASQNYFDFDDDFKIVFFSRKFKEIPKILLEKVILVQKMCRTFINLWVIIYDSWFTLS